jgi:membrane-associated protease RseP (regulator of RpoE activity)
MVSFYIIDITLLVLFTIGIIFFLKTHRRGMKREGIIFMYRTRLGIRAINYIGDNYKRTLHFLKYPIIIVSFLLMGAIIWIIMQSLLAYVFAPAELINLIRRAPPVAPLIPYFPEIFGLTSIFPSFYFIYFIVALAIVAIVHEFAHGIYMRLFNIRIKSTGFVFLGPILGAFVEEEKSQFEKKTKVQQMSVLGAGVFANVLTAIFFYLIFALYFSLAFTPSGVSFNTYYATKIPVNSVENVEQIGELYSLSANGNIYYLYGELAGQLNDTSLNEYTVYYNSPAVRNQIKGIIVQINDVAIKTESDYRRFMQDKNPGDELSITTILQNGTRLNYNIELAENPNNPGEPFLGIVLFEGGSVIQRSVFQFMRSAPFGSELNTIYSATFDREMAKFFLHFLWWIVLINFFVALFNMLPLGILDGGKFFFLAVWGITRSEKVAKVAYKIMTYLLLLTFLSMMIVWAIRVF